MPIYEYICEECNKRFSLLQSVHSSELNTECPKCASKKVKKTISQFSCSSNSDADSSHSLPSRGISGGG
jgi:putative FmdB family regulatory protein